LIFVEQSNMSTKIAAIPAKGGLILGCLITGGSSAAGDDVLLEGGGGGFDAGRLDDPQFLGPGGLGIFDLPRAGNRLSEQFGLGGERRVVVVEGGEAMAVVVRSGLFRRFFLCGFETVFPFAEKLGS
jgi:hypothetical protein